MTLPMPFKTLLITRWHMLRELDGLTHEQLLEIPEGRTDNIVFARRRLPMLPFAAHLHFQRTLLSHETRPQRVHLWAIYTRARRAFLRDHPRVRVCGR